MSALLTIEEAAERLRKTPRWLTSWLRTNPQDANGIPYCRQAGRTRLFTEDDFARLLGAIVAEQRTASRQVADLHEMLPYPTSTAAEFGWVYFLRAGDLIKIGHSQEPRGRLATLRGASPLKLDLLHIEPGPVSKERTLHRRFRRLRSHGEWFRAEHDLLAYIDLLKGGAK